MEAIIKSLRYIDSIDYDDVVTNENSNKNLNNYCDLRLDERDLPKQKAPTILITIDVNNYTMQSSIRKISNVSSVSSTCSEYSQQKQESVPQNFERICSKCKKRMNGNHLKLPEQNNKKKLHESQSYTNIFSSATTTFAFTSQSFSNLDSKKQFKSSRELCGTLSEMSPTSKTTTTTNTLVKCSCCLQKFYSLATTHSSFSVASLPAPNVYTNVNNASGSVISLSASKLTADSYFSDNDEKRRQIARKSIEKRHRLKSRKLKSAASRVKSHFSRLLLKPKAKSSTYLNKDQNNNDDNNDASSWTFHHQELDPNTQISMMLNTSEESKEKTTCFVSQNSKSTSALDDEPMSNCDSKYSVKLRAQLIAKDIRNKAENFIKRHQTDSLFGKNITPTYEELIKWQTSFENLLKHKYGIALFRGFLQTEFSDENIEFWLACEDFKQTTKEAKLTLKSKAIYTEFVAIGSPREVNLDIQLRLHTAERIIQPNVFTFELAQKRIQSLMEKDSYPRFLESNLFKNLLSSTKLNA